MAKAGNGYRFANTMYDRSHHKTKGRLIGKLYAHFGDGEGDVTLDFAVDNESPMWRVDVLQDIINLLNVEYEDAFDEMVEGFEEARKNREKELERMG